MTRSPRRLAGYLFLLPYLTLFCVFLLLPLCYGLVLSFQKYNLVESKDVAPTFVGLANYREAVADPYFRRALWATARFVIMAVPATVGLALLLAVGIESLPARRQGFYRLCIFIPTMITISVAGILWRWFYNSQFGVFNALLEPLGIGPVNWITDKRWAMPSIVLMTVWWTVGGPTVILLAGLKQIPDAYYEAAAIDGAVGWRRFIHITLPLLRPVLLFVLVLNVIGAFQIFGQTYIITRGEPEMSTRVLVQYIYDTAFNFYRMGYGSAMSWLLFLVIVAFSLIQFRVLREK
ncbi:MAG: sugar ABC transporter permease [Tepidisphaeraceae bacterium]